MIVECIMQHEHDKIFQQIGFRVFFGCTFSVPVSCTVHIYHSFCDQIHHPGFVFRKKKYFDVNSNPSNFNGALSKYQAGSALNNLP